ncbi:MAG: hypothetical protein WA441_11665 [Methyloceanibacter sp.]
MKSAIMAATFLALATSAEAAETWTCSPNGTPASVLFRFTISPPDVIFSLREDMRLRIVHNDDYGLVATGSADMTQLMLSQDQVWVYTVAINKVTGAFSLAHVKTAQDAADVDDQVQHGKCLKD